ncbi:helix-turn-helix transcriptional regulator [Hymenobacter saemangeumensis]|uniref:helix-turn-helix transcriptional regulator n=1 Tax=Hymenobacter saemangeumensis TaxID=1084522 RepID=UPI003CD05526
MNSKTFSTKLIKLRRERNFTQQQVAHLLSISQSTYCSWEMGSCFPNMRHVPSIANTFAVTIQELFDEKGENLSQLK